MKVSVLPGDQLGTDLLAAWRQLLGANKTLDSPYFTPEFTMAVASVRTDVEVAVIEEKGRIAAFFPYQRAGTLACPVGDSLSDYHGLICDAAYEPSACELLKHCKLLTFDFNNVLASQSTFTGFHDRSGFSPRMNLSRGHAAYVAERKLTHPGLVKKTANLARRLEREVGPLRIVANSRDRGALQQLMHWKSQQYIASDIDDCFAQEWPRHLLAHIMSQTSDTFAGMLSLLYAGDQLIAGHFGMRSQTVMHYWFPAYNQAFARYSPGMLLLFKMAESAPAHGISIIDLGSGPSAYKSRFMTSSVPLVGGSVELPSVRAHWRAARRFMRDQIRDTPAERPARRILGVVRYARRHLAQLSGHRVSAGRDAKHLPGPSTARATSDYQ